MAGVDGIILKEETTLSDHHSEIIRNLTEILFQMESLGEKKKHFDEITKIYKINREYISVLNHGNIQLDSIFESAVKMSFDLLASYIVLFTDNYKYAKFLSKYQPDCKIFCVTNDFCHHSYMNLCRGVVAYYTQKSDISSFNDELMSE